jgi:crossover junction endodeoxyribonuclease RuvC
VRFFFLTSVKKSLHLIVRGVMKYIGIDPGKKGSVSIVEDGHLTVIPVPIIGDSYDFRGMYELLCDHKDDSFCVIERAQAMPGQGTVSMFTFGLGFGLWLMALTATSIPYQIIHSRVWTKEILKGAMGEGKERSFNVARALYPEWSPKLKKEWEYSDSILLAEYAKRLMGEQWQR